MSPNLLNICTHLWGAALLITVSASAGELVVWKGRRQPIQWPAVAAGIAADRCVSTLMGHLPLGWKLIKAGSEKLTSRPLVGKLTPAVMHLSRYRLGGLNVLLVQEAQINLLSLAGPFDSERLYFGPREGIYRNADLRRQDTQQDIPRRSLDLAVFVDQVPGEELEKLLSNLIPLMKRGGRIEFQLPRDLRSSAWWMARMLSRFEGRISYDLDHATDWIIPELHLNLKIVFTVQ